MGVREQENEEREELLDGRPQRRDRSVEREDDESGEYESATDRLVGIRDRTAATVVHVVEIERESEAEGGKDQFLKCEGHLFAPLQATQTTKSKRLLRGRPAPIAARRE